MPLRVYGVTTGSAAPGRFRIAGSPGQRRSGIQRRWSHCVDPVSPQRCGCRRAGKKCAACRGGQGPQRLREQRRALRSPRSFPLLRAASNVRHANRRALSVNLDRRSTLPQISGRQVRPIWHGSGANSFSEQVTGPPGSGRTHESTRDGYRVYRGPLRPALPGGVSAERSCQSQTSHSRHSVRCAASSGRIAGTWDGLKWGSR